MSRPLIEARSASVQLYSKKDYQILFSKNSLLSDKDILPNEPGKIDRKKINYYENINPKNTSHLFIKKI